MTDADAGSDAASRRLVASDLPARWRRRDRFVVLETDFGDGTSFLSTLGAWRADAERPRRLDYLAMRPHPPAGWRPLAGHASASLAALAIELAAAWPPSTPDLHRLSFDGDAVQLLLAFGPVATWLPQWVASVDAFFVDESDGWGEPAMRRATHGEDTRFFKALARLALPGATIAMAAPPKGASEAMRAAGFVAATPESESPDPAPMLAAQYRPAATMRTSPRRRTSFRVDGNRPDERVAIIGAGLAGCAAAWALAEHGIDSVLIERRAEVALETTAVAAGLFHGVVHRADGPHARFNRAASFEARRAVAIALTEHGVAGAIDGVLRLHAGGHADARSRSRSLEALEALEALDLPADYVRAVDVAEASRLAGAELAHGGWFFPGGGWVDGRGLALSFVARAAGRTRLAFGREVVRLHRRNDAWNLLDAEDRSVATARAVVCANASDALRLLAPFGAQDWPLERIRGQVSIGRIEGAQPADWPRLPVTGNGYLLPASAGRIAFGATSQTSDDDPSPRRSDHFQNIGRLAGLLREPPPIDAMSLEGRTGWRLASVDRLPLIGAVPGSLMASHSPIRFDQPHHVTREPGLFVFTALASRGIHWAALGGRILASWLSGAPAPVGAHLLDAVDPARFVSRAVRRSRAEPSRPVDAPE